MRARPAPFMALTLLLAQSVNAGEAPLPGWGKRGLGTYRDFTFWVAEGAHHLGVAPLGAQRFTILRAYSWGFLRFDDFDVASGYKRTDQIIGADDVRGDFVTANSGPAVRSLLPVMCNPVPPTGIRWTNFFAVGDGRSARVVKREHCAGWKAPSVNRLDTVTDPNVRVSAASVAWSGEESGQGLLVWGEKAPDPNGGSILSVMGRAFNRSLTPLGPPFVIASRYSDHTSALVRSTDVVYSEAARGFIAGWRWSAPTRFCEVANQLVGGSGPYRIWGTCEDELGGPATTAAATPTTGQSGLYAWAYEGFAGQGVYIHDALGYAVGGLEDIGSFSHLGVVANQYAHADGAEYVTIRNDTDVRDFEEDVPAWSAAFQVDASLEPNESVDTIATVPGALIYVTQTHWSPGSDYTYWLTVYPYP